MKSVILSTGSYLPEKFLTNAEISKMVDTTDEWIVERTGIKKRHVAAEGEFTSDIAAKAALKALAKANLTANDIDLIIVATTTPDRTFPATAVILQGKIGNKKAAAFDVQAVCSGFVFAMATADNFLKSGQYKRALVIGAETITRIVDWNDRGTCILFGDGAGAVILEAQNNTDRGILAHSLHSESVTDILYTTGGTSHNQLAGKIIMEGKEVFKHAVTKLTDCTLETLKIANISKDQISWLIPHQANTRILEATAKRLEISEDRVIVTVPDHGNTSAASIPLALDVAVNAGKVKQGDIISMQAIGGGLTWGSVLLKF
jgi:3-oxoacyl-[acyl-carrier-protein] synthase-3